VCLTTQWIDTVILLNKVAPSLNSDRACHGGFRPRDVATRPWEVGDMGIIANSVDIASSYAIQAHGRQVRETYCQTENLSPSQVAPPTAESVQSAVNCRWVASESGGYLVSEDGCLISGYVR
jgi:hypothetical protein